jgi:hypothetical protein
VFGLVVKAYLADAIDRNQPGSFLLSAELNTRPEVC